MSRPDVAIVGPRIVDGTGRAELSFGAMISPWAELRQKLLVRGNDRGLRIVTDLVDRMTRRTHLVDWVSGACLLIRRRDLDEVGGFDPRFFMYAEDVDLCAAVRARGESVLFSRRSAGRASARAICRFGPREASRTPTVAARLLFTPSIIPPGSRS